MTRRCYCLISHLVGPFVFHLHICTFTASFTTLMRILPQHGFAGTVDAIFTSERYENNRLGKSVHPRFGRFLSSSLFIGMAFSSSRMRLCSCETESLTLVVTSICALITVLVDWKTSAAIYPDYSLQVRPVDTRSQPTSKLYNQIICHNTSSSFRNVNNQSVYFSWPHTHTQSKRWKAFLCKS